MVNHNANFFFLICCVFCMCKKIVSRRQKKIKNKIEMYNKVKIPSFELFNYSKSAKYEPV